ncbi:unnamed protein product [Lota lota]
MTDPFRGGKKKKKKQQFNVGFSGPRRRLDSAPSPIRSENNQQGPGARHQQQRPSPGPPPPRSSVTLASQDILSHRQPHSSSVSSCEGGLELRNRRGALQRTAGPQLQPVAPAACSSL